MKGDDQEDEAWLVQHHGNEYEIEWKAEDCFLWAASKTGKYENVLICTFDMMRRCIQDPQKSPVFRRHYGEDTYRRLAWKWHQSNNFDDLRWHQKRRDQEISEGDRGDESILDGNIDRSEEDNEGDDSESENEGSDDEDGSDDEEEEEPTYERLFVLTSEEFLDKSTKRTFAYTNGLSATLKPLILAKYNRSIRDNYADIIKWLGISPHYTDPDFHLMPSPDHFMTTGIYLMLREGIGNGLIKETASSNQWFLNQKNDSSRLIKPGNFPPVGCWGLERKSRIVR